MGAQTCRRPFGFQKPPEATANAGIISQLFQNLRTDDLVEAVGLEIDLIEIAEAKAQLLLGNGMEFVEQPLAARDLVLLEGDANDAVSHQMTFISEHAVAAASIKYAAHLARRRNPEMLWQDGGAMPSVKIHAVEQEPFEVGPEIHTKDTCFRLCNNLIPVQGPERSPRLTECRWWMSNLVPGRFRLS